MLKDNSVLVSLDPWDMGMGALQYSINNFAKGVDKWIVNLNDGEKERI